jgi:hypothetical protein
LLSNTKIAIQQRYLGETKLKVVVLLSRVERDKTLGEIAIPNYIYAQFIHAYSRAVRGGRSLSLL